jgi:hypothetical protein
MIRRTRAVALAVACGVLGASSGARADSAEVTATALFEEGRRLMGQNRFGEACPKLAESQRLAPSGGTLINLAECYEKAGQTASAWVAWKDVAARANAAGKADVEKTAITRAAALEPALARLTLSVSPDTDVPGLEVQRDGIAVGHAEFGLSIPVDPGSHTVEATAPNRQPLSTRVEVAPKQTDARLTITLAPLPLATSGAALAQAPGPANGPPARTATAPAAPSIAPEADGAGSTMRTLGWVGVGTGAAGLVLGSIFGLTAISKNNSATSDGQCSGTSCATRGGVSDTRDAQNAATLSNVFFVVGGVLTGAGVVLVLTAPSGPSVRLAPAVGQSAGGLALSGAW